MSENTFDFCIDCVTHSFYVLMHRLFMGYLPIFFFNITLPWSWDSYTQFIEGMKLSICRYKFFLQRDLENANRTDPIGFSQFRLYTNTTRISKIFLRLPCCRSIRMPGIGISFLSVVSKVDLIFLHIESEVKMKWFSKCVVTQQLKVTSLKHDCEP